MEITPEMIARVREAGARDRKLNNVERVRNRLSGIVDTGMLTDDEVLALWGQYQSARDARANRL